MNLPELLTKDEVVEIFKTSKSSICRLMDGRKIPFHKIGGGIRFNKKDILEYLEKNKIEIIE